MSSESKKNTPLIKTINDFMSLLKALMVLVFIGYCFSGLTIINPDEIGLILRMGKLNGMTRLDQIHNPGWLLALPQPFDEVLKIPVKQILEVKIRELAAINSKNEIDRTSIDPLKEGYCISGDENIFQASILVKYQISDPIQAVFGFTASFSTFNRLIYDLTVAEMTRVAARFNIDGLLSENKKQLSEQVKALVQAQLDKLLSGLTLVSVEIEELAPPVFLKRDFEEVNSAFINRRNFINEANSLSEEKLPKARGAASEMINGAHAYKQTVVAEATAEAGRFEKLLRAYSENTEEVKLEMSSRVHKLVIEKMRNMVVFPSLKDCQAGIRSVLNGNGKSILPQPVSVNPFYDEENESINNEPLPLP